MTNYVTKQHRQLVIAFCYWTTSAARNVPFWYSPTLPEPRYTQFVTSPRYKQFVIFHFVTKPRYHGSSSWYSILFRAHVTSRSLYSILLRAHARYIPFFASQRYQQLVIVHLVVQYTITAVNGIFHTRINSLNNFGSIETLISSTS